MVRMQIQLTESEVEAVRREAARRRVSISAVVREAVDRCIAQPVGGVSLEERRARAVAACGRFRSGLGDVSARHDEYFADSIDE
ncbi:MAG: ribbon-helix-helix protein, CopG family [Thermoleophilia bacterium]